MQYRILGQWPLQDILPTTVIFHSATVAIRQYKKLIKSGLARAVIQAIDENGTSRISPHKLETLSRAEWSPSKKAKRQIRNTFASVLLGVVVSALPNGFGDFGVVSGFGTLRAAKNARMGGRRISFCDRVPSAEMVAAYRGAHKELATNTRILETYVSGNARMAAVAVKVQEQADRERARRTGTQLNL